MRPEFNLTLRRDERTRSWLIRATLAVPPGERWGCEFAIEDREMRPGLEMSRLLPFVEDAVRRLYQDRYRYRPLPPGWPDPPSVRYPGSGASIYRASIPMLGVRVDRDFAPRPLRSARHISGACGIGGLRAGSCAECFAELDAKPVRPAPVQPETCAPLALILETLA